MQPNDLFSAVRSGELAGTAGSTITTYINNGQLYFGNDLYHRDDKLVPVVMPGAWPSKEIVDAVQALRRIASA